MLRFRKLFLPLLLVVIASEVSPCRAVNIYAAPKYNLDSLCYISTDIVEASLVRHSSAGNFAYDTFTATVLDTLGGDYKVGDKIDLPYNQIVLPPQHSCSLCILFIARKDFQLDLEDAKTTFPKVQEVLPVDEFGRVQRYFQWNSQVSTSSPSAEDDPAEQKFPTVTEECQAIVLRWAAVDQMRPLLSHALRQEDVIHLLNVNRQRLRSRGPSPTLEDVIGEVIHARLTDLHNPASHQSAALAYNIRIAGILQHIICVH